MQNLHVRDEADEAAPLAQSGAEVHVFGVEKVPLIKETSRLGGAATDTEAGPADPVVVAGPARDSLHVRRDEWPPRSMPSDEDLLAAFIERPQHSAEREFGAALPVEETGATRDHLGIAIERRDQPVHGIGPHLGVRVQKQQELSVRRGDADVVCSRKANIALEGNHPHVRKFQPDDEDRLVG